MTIYVIPKKAGFFDASIHGEIPDGAIEISVEQHASLMGAQQCGKIIDWSGGVPVAVDRPTPSEKDLSVIARSRRAAMLSDCDWTQLPDAPVDQLAWRLYRQALRDIPEQAGFPFEIDWPVAPY